MIKKLNFLLFCLFGISASAFSYEKTYKNFSIQVAEDGSPYGYNLSVIPPISFSAENIFNQLNNVKRIDTPIWSISTRKLPIKEDDCDAANIMTCNEESRFCYNHCLVSSPPDVLAVDEKDNKIYFLVGTCEIGTGGGTAFLFVTDINKNKVKLLYPELDQEKGSLSPSGRYFLMHGYNIIKMYDTQNNYQRVELNTSENIYNEQQDIRHKLTIKKWLNDTQFVYIDIARHFVRPIPENGEPFYSAKEVLYDLANRKILSEHKITKDEADAYEKLYN